MLIQWLPYLAAPGQVAVVGPTYGEHAVAWTKRARSHRGYDLGEVPESAFISSSSTPTIPMDASPVVTR